MDILAGLFDSFGALWCHQLLERTLVIGGRYLPVCARDTGIYTGIFIALVYLLLRRRFKSDQFPPTGMSVALCLCMLPMILDGISSYAGFRTTNNLFRLYTGFFFGFPLPLFLIPAAHFKTGERNHRAVLDRWTDIILLGAVNGIVGWLLLKDLWIPWLLISAILFFAPVFTVGRLAYTLLRRNCFTGPRVGWFTAGITLLVFFGMYLVSSFVLQPLKKVLLDFPGFP